MTTTTTTTAMRQKKIRRQTTNTTRLFMPKVTQFDIVKERLKLAWNAMYDDPFPSGTFALVDRSTAKLPPAPHELAATATATAAAVANTMNKELNINYNPLTYTIYDLKKE